MSVCTSPSDSNSKISGPENIKMHNNPHSCERSSVGSPKILNLHKPIQYSSSNDCSVRSLSTTFGKLSGSQSQPRNTPSLSNLIHISPRPSNIRQEPEQEPGEKAPSPCFDIERTVSRHRSSSVVAEKAELPVAGATVNAAALCDVKKDKLYGETFDFKIPYYENCKTVTVSLGNKKSGNGRRSSLDSLMNAVQTLSDNNVAEVKKSIMKKNSDYQFTLTRLIELKNKTSEEIKSWPLTQANQGLHNHELISCLLDNVPLNSIKTMSELSEQQAFVTKELLTLKKERDMEILGRRCSYDTNCSTPSGRRNSQVSFPPMQILPAAHSNPLQPQLGSYKFPHLDSGQSLGSQTILPPITANRLTQGKESFRPRGATFSVNLKPSMPLHRSAFSDSMVSLSHEATNSNVARAPSVQHAGGVGKPKLNKLSPVVLPKNMVGKSSNGSSRKNSYGTMECVHCARKDTPEWRRGPYGNRTVCNACGLFYGKLIRKFGAQKANIIMHYRRSTLPEDRRVPSTFFVPESFVSDLQTNEHLNADFSVAR